jgi:uncharacterized membrane protein YraQ (UPF0718 family)
VREARSVTKALGGWLFLAAVGLLYGAIDLLNPPLAAEALAELAPLLRRVLPVLGLVFGLLFLANLLLDRKWLVRHLGRAASPGGWALAVVCGIFSAGPLYAWYPLLGELKEKGMSSALIATFLYSRALKLPLLPLMVHYFGAAYTAALSVCIIVFSVLCGLIMKRFAGIDIPEEKEGSRK